MGFWACGGGIFLVFKGWDSLYEQRRTILRKKLCGVLMFYGFTSQWETTRLGKGTT